MRTAKATLIGIETIRTIKRGHIHNKQPGVKGEIAFIASLFAVVSWGVGKTWGYLCMLAVQ